MPVDRGSVDLTWRNHAEYLEAFDAIEQALRVIGEFREIVDLFGVQGVNPAEAFAHNKGSRARFLKLTRSAAHLYTAFAASALDRRGFEKVLGVSFADFGEMIIIAIDVLGYRAKTGAHDE
jgi:hypothetical protein